MAAILFNDPESDITNLLAFINNFTRDLGIADTKLNVGTLESIMAGMLQDFPHCDGTELASPFKKAANFLCYFVSERPILDAFPADNIGEDIAAISNHQNALVGFMFVTKALHEATLQRNGETVTVEHPIQISRHSLLDIIDALSHISPATHFKLVSVFLEQLVYKTNPNCQYPVAGT